MPIFISLAMIVAGIVIAAFGGLLRGSLLGGIVAAAGLVPACIAAWKGTQQEGQGMMLKAILLIFVSLGVGGILIALQVVDWIR